MGVTKLVASDARLRFCSLSYVIAKLISKMNCNDLKKVMEDRIGDKVNKSELNLLCERHRLGKATTMPSLPYPSSRPASPLHISIRSTYL